MWWWSAPLDPFKEGWVHNRFLPSAREWIAPPRRRARRPDSLRQGTGRGAPLPARRAATSLPGHKQQHEDGQALEEEALLLLLLLLLLLAVAVAVAEAEAEEHHEHQAAPRTRAAHDEAPHDVVAPWNRPPP